MLLVARPSTLTMRTASFVLLALALLNIHCMRAVSAAEDGHYPAAAEQQQASCPAPSSSAAALQATVDQLMHELGNLRRDMQELKAAAARPVPGTIVDPTKCGLFTACSCPEGSKKIFISSDRDYVNFWSISYLFGSGKDHDYHYYVCVAE
jgi:hypothetical protein